MDKRFSRLTVLLFLQLPAGAILAQCDSTTCNVPVPAFAAWKACILPSPDALNCYAGQTTNSTPQSFPPYWCSHDGNIDNNQWFAFVADSISAFFEIGVPSCSSGEGVQAAILGTSDCVNFEFKGLCAEIEAGTTGIVAAVWSLVPGEVYFLMIDGYYDGLCDYTINATPYIAGGLTHGICLPTAQLSEFYSFSDALWSINPPDAGIISGANPSSHVFAEWLLRGVHEICVSSADCPDAPPNCVEIDVQMETFDSLYLTLCEGSSVACGGLTVTEPGTYFNKANLDFDGCDSNLTCIVDMLPLLYAEETVILCQGESVDCGGQTFDWPGNYDILIHPSSIGCDSLHTCHVVLAQPVEMPLAEREVCAGGSIQVCGETFNATGIHVKNCATWQGCDSTVQVDLLVLDPQPVIQPPAVLACLPGAFVELDGTASFHPLVETSVQWSGPGIMGAANQYVISVNEPGTYCLEVTQQRNGFSCSKSTCVEVELNDDPPATPIVIGELTVCDGAYEAYTAIPTGDVQATGYEWTLPNGETIVTQYISLIEVDWTDALSGLLCVRAFNPCDESPEWCVPITVTPPLAQPQLTGPATICKNGGAQTYSVANPQAGATYFWSVSAGASFTGSGANVSANLTNLPPGLAQVCVTASSDCGSKQTCLDVQVAAPPTASLSGGAGICAGETATLVFNLSGSPPFHLTYSDGSQNLPLTGVFNGHQLPVNPSQTTTYSLVSVSDNACASAASGSATVVVWQAASASQAAAICEGESLWLGGGLQTSPGVYLDHYLTWHGCDSLVTTTLTVHKRDSVFLFETSCNPTNAGVFVQNLDNQNGCDSVVTRTVSFAQSDTTLLFGNTCDLAAAGVFSQNLVTPDGCDSLVILTVSLQPGSDSEFFQMTCHPNLAGVSVQIFPNQFGCDSTVTTTVTLVPLDTTFLFGETCDPSLAGVSVQNLTTPGGCDSVVISEVNLAPLDTTFLFGETCDPSLAGVSVQNLTTPGGCDSVVISEVNLAPLDTTFLFGETCDPSLAGVSVQNLTSAGGCDSVVISEVNLAPLDTTFLFGETCDPSLAGVFVQNLTSAGGCDSVVVGTVILLASDTTLLFGTSCQPGSTGVFTQNLTNLDGCDSTVILTVSFALSDTTLLAGTTCDAGAAGVFTQNLQTWEGCDSLVISTVTLLPSDTTLLFGTSCNPGSTGVFTQNLTNFEGCDSTVILTVAFAESDTTLLDGTTCDAGTAGVFTQNLQTWEGCDSLVISTVTLLPSDTTFLAATTCDPAQAGTSNTLFLNQSGCDSLVILTVSLLPPAECGVSATLLGSTIPCDQTTGSLTLTATLGQPPFNFEVLLGGTQVATGSVAAVGQPEIIGGLSAGNYVVNLTSAGGFTAILQATIGQLLPPSAAVAATSDFNGFEVGCAGGSDGSALATVGGGVAPFGFAWSNGQATPEILGLSAGVYGVTVTGANGCTATASATLDEPEPLRISFIVNNLKCFEENAGAIRAQAEGGAAPYRFSMDGVNFQDAEQFTGLPAGAYEITALDANDCETTEMVWVNEPVAVGVDLGADLTISAGDGVTLDALLNVPFDSIASVVWVGLDSAAACAGCLEQHVAPLVTTTYAVTVLGKNGCSDSDEATVFVDRRKSFYVPNTISPNDDGVNDWLQIFAKPGTVKNVRSFRIFNRWGGVVWQQFNFQPNDPAVGWDGRFQGKALDPAVFAWLAAVEFEDGEVRIFEGDVTLMR